MQRMLLAVTIFGFSSVNLGGEHEDASSNTRLVPTSNKITVVFTKQGKIIARMPTKAVARLSNGDRKIYGEIVFSDDRRQRKYTLSGNVRPADIAADGTVHVDKLRNLRITNRRLKRDNERHRQTKCRSLVATHDR